MKNSQVADAFRNGNEQAKTEHLFIEGNVIYSYGYHFPIAIKLNNRTLLFNADGYSQTTAKHKGYVKRTFEGWTFISKNTHELRELAGRITTTEELALTELSRGEQNK